MLGTELPHVVQARAEGPKAPSPGHRPGYTSNQPCALKGQKPLKIRVIRAYFSRLSTSGSAAITGSSSGSTYLFT